MKIFRNLLRFAYFHFCFSGLPINFRYYYQTFRTLKYKINAENSFLIFFSEFFRIFFWGGGISVIVSDFWDNSFLEIPEDFEE